MKNTGWIFILFCLLGVSGFVLAQESAPGAAVAASPTDQQIQDTIKEYIAEESVAAEGYFEVYDPDTDKIRRLHFEQMGTQAGETGEYYYSCAIFKDADTAETIDLDLDVEDLGGGDLEVVDVRIHKINDVPRYTYDEKDNRIPLLDTGTRVSTE